MFRPQIVAAGIIPNPIFNVNIEFGKSFSEARISNTTYVTIINASKLEVIPVSLKYPM